MHCAKNNLKVCIKTEVFTAEADAMVFVYIYEYTYTVLYIISATETRHIPLNLLQR